ncbi:hypothetical protein [Thermoleptolyngbya sp.]
MTKRPNFRGRLGCGNRTNLQLDGRLYWMGSQSVNARIHPFVKGSHRVRINCSAQADSAATRKG